MDGDDADRIEEVADLKPKPPPRLAPRLELSLSVVSQTKLASLAMAL